MFSVPPATAPCPPREPTKRVSSGILPIVYVPEATALPLIESVAYDGIVAELRATAGDFVEADAVLATLEPQA